MSGSNYYLALLRQPVWSVCLGVLWCVAISASALAAPPLEPLAPPYYSFDLESPKVIDLEILVEADDVLELDHPHPRVAIEGWELGMGVPGDELDAVSIGHPNLGPDDSFAILFSVDRGTVGVAPPDPTLVALGVPYNVTDQAAKGQAAGDEYMSTMLCTRTSGCALEARPLNPNNVLFRNNYNEGGTDSAAGPSAGAGEDATGEEQDNMDGSSGSSSGKRDRQITDVYFSASSVSPSLISLSGEADPSGANIFHNPGPFPPRAPTTVYASFTQLGLVQADDIDGLIVFDTNGDSEFNGTDYVLFSLTSGSPSLATIPGTSEDGAGADVFLAVYGTPPTPFIAAVDLGMGHSADNIDALEYLPCDDAQQCATFHGIRLDSSVPTVSGWGLIAMTILFFAVGSVVLRRGKARAACAAASGRWNKTRAGL